MVKRLALASCLLTLVGAWIPVALAAAPPAGAPAAEAAGGGDAGGATSKQKHVTATFMADVDAVAPGASFTVGVRYQLEPHWHVYWHYPGDTGLPTEVTFNGRDGFDYGAVQYPAPRRFETRTGIKGFGYEDEVLLFAEVTAPAALLDGESVTLHADTSWLVCREGCIPGQAQLALTLPVEAPSAGAPAAAGANVAHFVAARAKVPAPPPADLSIEPLLSVAAVGPGDAWQLAFRVSDSAGRAVSHVDFLPAPAEGLKLTGNIADTTGTGVPTGGFVVRIDGAASEDVDLPADRVGGVLQLERAGERLDVAVAAALPRRAPDAAVTRSDHPVFASWAPPTAAAPAPTSAVGAAEATPDAEADASFLLMLLFAFVGGLILNVMPCVLPVLSIKILGLVQQAGEDRRVIWRHGVFYALGILVSFGALATLIILIQASGNLAGWGFQFQEPAFVAVLGALIFAFGLSLFGVFEVAMPGSNKLDQVAAGRHGYSGSFFNGVFATVLATPCTAPFLAPALGYALSQPPLMLSTLLLTVGLGLATPFLILAAFPRWARAIKPGPWMETFKQFMGFLLIATLIWLLDVFGQQVSRGAFTGYLAFLAIIGLSAWVYGRWGNAMRATSTRWIAALTAVGLIVAGAFVTLSTEPPPDDGAEFTVSGGISWRNFKRTDVEELAAAGHTVFIDFTAAWCATCKVMEETVIDTQPVKTLLKDLNVVPVKADWTRRDARITAWLDRFNRRGVPMYIILPAGQPERPILLPDLLTTESLINGLKQAGPSKTISTS